MFRNFRPNLPLPTLGGKQLWADRRHFRGWRVQQHALTGHCRLLDNRGVRRAWGTLLECSGQLDVAKRRHSLAPYDGDVVVTLHGLGRTRAAMNVMCRHLESSGFDTCNVSYPSTRCDIGTNAKHLAEIVAGLEGAKRIHFVGHSLGGILTRHYLADRQRDGENNLPPVGRVVMLASPNQGATIAVRLARLGLLQYVLGSPLAELGRDWRALESRLATPQDFAIIAGCRGRDSGYNPLLAGDDDLIVSVQEAQLPGAAATMTIPTFHAFIMKHPETLRQTTRFLKTGRFE